MSGPVRTEDVSADLGDGSGAPGPELVVTESRTAPVGAFEVRRALPYRARRTVGAWCFVDHMGPVQVDDPSAVGIGPHPHTGLQTVTWLLDGELRHRDSLGSDQVIRPGQLNLMTAGHGVAHAEEPTGHRGRFQGMQLWVAQPERTRHGAAAFEHHAELPQVELAEGVATVLVGALGDAVSPARRDTDHIGIDLHLRPGRSTVPLTAAAEHALVVAEGAVALPDSGRGEAPIIEPGHLAYLGTGREELVVEVREPTRVLLIGGSPFESPVVMWWNFVARSRDEMGEAQRSWNDDDGRFGAVASELDRIPAPGLPWS